jgi:uncharacterized repeat protein (TIGR03803 family)
MRVVVLIFFGFVLASCTRATGPSLIPSEQPVGASTSSARQSLRALSGFAYKLLYGFKANPDGANPKAGLIALKDMLYGTTATGGTNNGTVFAISTSGKERVIYSFKNSPSQHGGAFPEAGLIAVKGVLYGTTASGGQGDSGTVFAVSTSGKKRVLYTFKGNTDGYTDGASPDASLIFVDDKLYGTTYEGGTAGLGTVFSVTTSGKEHVIHSFKGGSDGASPEGGLRAVNGTLYGTTTYGGGYGTIFAISASGKERTIYAFKGPPDGMFPRAGLIRVDRTLYGTTFYGGTACRHGSPRGCGTVFAVSTSGTERVVYGFKGGADGAYPQAGLIAVNGKLYGTTSKGGGTREDGTAFVVSTSGLELVLHSFRGGPNDGVDPVAALRAMNGLLYGTTSGGGPDGDGTVFAMSALGNSPSILPPHTRR